MFFLSNSGFIIERDPFDLVDDKVFDPLFLNGFLVAALVILHANALVIPMYDPGMARAGFSRHVAVALAAEQFSGQQILVLHLEFGVGFSPLIF